MKAILGTDHGIVGTHEIFQILENKKSLLFNFAETPKFDI